jgi:uncharacterized membrane protein
MTASSDVRDDVEPEPAAAEADPAGTPPTRRRYRHPIALVVLSVLAAGVYAASEFLQYSTFHAGTYDLVIFDQAVRSYSHFHLPLSLVAGVHRGFGTDFTLLGDHFSPVLALLAPLYWVHSGPQTLLVAQAVLFAAAIAPLWVFTRRESHTTWGAYCVVVAYAVSWPVAAAVSFDFHEVAFAPLLTALLFERFSAFRRGTTRWWWVALPAVGLLGVKEDMGLLVAGFGLAVLVVSPRWADGRRRQVRLLGAGFVLGGLVTALVTTDVVLPAFGSRPTYYWRYGQFGANAPAAAWQMLTHPSVTADTFVTPDTKVHTMVCLFAIAAFAALVSPYLLVVLPLLAERMLSDAPNWWGLVFHYNAFLVVPLLCAGVDAVSRIARWSTWWSNRPRERRWVTAVGRWIGVGLGPLWATAVLVVALCTVGSFAFAPLLHTSSWRQTAHMTEASDAVGHVPSGVTVEAPNTLGPRLSDRTTVVLLDFLPRWAPWVVVDTAAAEFPFCTAAEQQERVPYLLDHGYRIAYRNDDYVVLHAAGPLPPMDTAASPGCPA